MGVVWLKSGEYQSHGLFVLSEQLTLQSVYLQPSLSPQTHQRSPQYNSIFLMEAAFYPLYRQASKLGLELAYRVFHILQFFRYTLQCYAHVRLTIIDNDVPFHLRTNAMHSPLFSYPSPQG